MAMDPEVQRTSGFTLKTTVTWMAAVVWIRFFGAVVFGTLTLGGLREKYYADVLLPLWMSASDRRKHKSIKA
jgi:hypothetical protein